MHMNMGTQFVWWTGVVESRQDPKKVGRCRVRIIGAHSEKKTEIPTESLHWAHPMMPLNDSASLQIKEGDMVVGFYFDGADSQVPIIMGILPGIPEKINPSSMGFADPRTFSDLSGAPKNPANLTVTGVGSVTITEGFAVRYPKHLNESTLSRLARNEKISKTPIQFKKDSVATAVPTASLGTWDEPKTPYGAKYPYNRVMETESGHILEFDDTPGAERIHIYHRSGTFDEYHPDGTKVTRIHADAYEIVLSDKNVYIAGDCNITAQKSVNIKAGENINFEAVGNITINAGAAFTSQALLAQNHSTVGPMNLNGIPLNLNGPPLAVLPPPLPVIVPIVATYTPD